MVMDKVEKAQRQVLLSQGLVEIYDPLQDIKMQVTVEAAQRYAKVNKEVADLLKALDLEPEKDKKKADEEENNEPE